MWRSGPSQGSDGTTTSVYRLSRSLRHDAIGPNRIVQVTDVVDPVLLDGIGRD
jgi:hypothetical protein